MNTIRVTKEFTFEMAHALNGYDGKCQHIHGHSYHLSVTVAGPTELSSESSKQGMVIDFSLLKALVREKILDIYDHALVLNRSDSRIESLSDTFTNLIIAPFQPTCENLVIDFVNRITFFLPEGIKLQALRLRETESSYAEWSADD